MQKKVHGNRIDAHKLASEHDIGTMFGNMEVVAYLHSNGTIHLFPESDREVADMFHKYVIYCHECGTTKIMDSRNILKVASCGCRHPFMGRNFNWEGKSKKV